LSVTDASPDGGAVFDVANTWTETGINWNNAPQPSASALANAGVVAKGGVVEITLPLSEFTRGNGTYSFELVTGSTDSAIYSSREAATGKPQLVLAQGGGSLPTLTADFRSDKQTGTAPLTVAFDSTPSTGNPTSWTWDFNNDNVVDSTQQNPTFLYSTPGTYTVKLTIGDGSTTSLVTKTNFITVSSVVTPPPPPPPGGFAVLVADAYVANSKPTTNYGTATTLQLRQGTPSNNITYHTYLQFNVSGLTGPVTSAKLRLSVTDASPDGGSIFDVANAWTEAGINWNNAPQPTSGTPLAIAGAVAKGAIVNINLPLNEFVRGNGTYSFELVTSSTDSAIFNSKQSSSPPQLILTQ
jgi:PKD repeat protein